MAQPWRTDAEVMHAHVIDLPDVPEVAASKGDCRFPYVVCSSVQAMHNMHGVRLDYRSLPGLLGRLTTDVPKPRGFASTA